MNNMSSSALHGAPSAKALHRAPSAKALHIAPSAKALHTAPSASLERASSSGTHGPQNDFRPSVGCCGALNRLIFGAPSSKKKTRMLKGHKGIKLLQALDDVLSENLKDNSIRLIRADFLRHGTIDHIVRRQDLEARQKKTKERIFLPARQAAALLAKCSREIGVLTYAWTTARQRSGD